MRNQSKKGCRQDQEVYKTKLRATTPAGKVHCMTIHSGGLHTDKYHKKTEQQNIKSHRACRLGQSTVTRGGVRRAQLSVAIDPE